ncbi:Ras-related protein RABC1 [Triticum urartu]|uniref:Ras-related protein RABC1 n=3 Tax=Triticum TaxID=4564 RepID=M8AT14_TRIUA|nr:Ras-related protein RABC1 [Triticum urartu]
MAAKLEDLHDNNDEDLKVIDVSHIKSLLFNMNLDKDETGDESTLVKRCSNDSEFLDLDNKSGIGEFGPWPLSSTASSSQAQAQPDFDYLFKLLLIGDSGVGKSSLLLRFTSDSFEDLSPTIGVDFKVKMVNIAGKKLKLAVWDTAGQERFRTLTSSYYRGAQGIIMVYDVTRRETFTNLSDIWAKEIDLYSTNQDCIKMLVGNKVDKESERAVTKKEGIDFAREYGCLFLECSAKTKVNVEQCFEELVLKILDTPSLLADASSGAKKNIFKQKAPEADAAASGCC